MKFLSLFVFLLGIQQVTIAQSTADSVIATLNGKWEVIFEENGSSISADLFTKLDKEDVFPQGEHNNSQYFFKPEGEFHIISIKDYNQGAEDGTYMISEDGTKLERLVKMPYAQSPKAQEKLRKKKSKILYLDEDKFVIKTAGKVIYLKRM